MSSKSIVIKEDTALLVDLARNSSGAKVHRVNSLLTGYRNFLCLAKSSRKKKDKLENYDEALKCEKELRKIISENKLARKKS